MSSPAQLSSTSASPWKSSSRNPYRAMNLGVELFATRAEAEAQIAQWQSKGLQNLWLHEVAGVEVSDLHALMPAKLPLRRSAAGPLYAIVRLG